ncbi:hypothetical protein K501DRAFT_332639 [Backusella circina FSU 941]|nr:hypothetical protein K501DRAFT_332639 [Backusella circina FSU 941]
MSNENYEYDARKIWNFENEDQNEINDNWFAHRNPDPLVFLQATEEEFKLRLPVTPNRAQGAVKLGERRVEYGRNDPGNIEQVVVPLVGTAREEKEQLVADAVDDNTIIFAENISLKPSKAIHPPRMKHQSVFDRLRAHTAASAGKLSKQTTIQKKHPPQYTNKPLKKKLVLQDRQQSKVTRNSTISKKINKAPVTKATTSKDKSVLKAPLKTISKALVKPISKAPVKPSPKEPIKAVQKTHVKTFTPRTITTTASTTPKKRQRNVSTQSSSSNKVPHYMQPTASAQNKLRGLKRQQSASYITSNSNVKRLRKS